MITEGDAKIKMISASMRCFWCGLLTIIPVFGLIFLGMTFHASDSARAIEKRFWNVARPYRIWGCFIAGASTVNWVLAFVILLFNHANHLAY
jgi:hypothetical protein